MNSKISLVQSVDVFCLLPAFNSFVVWITIAAAIACITSCVPEDFPQERATFHCILHHEQNTVGIWKISPMMHLKSESYHLERSERLPLFFTRGVNIDTLAAAAWVWQTQWPAECQQWRSRADVCCDIQTRQQNEDGPSVTASVSVLSGVLSPCPSGLLYFLFFFTFPVVLTHFAWVRVFS